VRGILTFNGILLVVFRFDFNAFLRLEKVLLAAALAYILCSIAISLGVFLVRWGRLEEYAKFEDEFTFKAEVLGDRTRLINCAVALSFLSAAAVATVVIVQFTH
jgi:hypothetical protein